tara:strand:+ start:204 stop:1199 length:996 start_codon:yes stop_codon:yes gene_type:complete
MRVLLTVLILLSASLAYADDSDLYEVKEGDTWESVLKASPNYQGRAGIGLAGLLAHLNEVPKLTPGAEIRLAPLTEMLGQSKVLTEVPEAMVLIDARNFALKWVDAACGPGIASADVGPLSETAKGIWLRLRKLGKSPPWWAEAKLPYDAFVQVAQLAEQFESSRSGRKRFLITKCNNYVAILKRSGLALARLSEGLAKRSQSKERASLAEVEMVSQWPELAALLEARDFASKWRRRHCSELQKYREDFPLSAIEKRNRESTEIEPRLQTLIDSLPPNAPKRARRKLKWIAETLAYRPKWQMTCKLYVSMGRDCGRVLDALSTLSPGQHTP